MADKNFISTQDLINALERLGEELKNITAGDEEVFQQAYYKNNWFTRENVELAIRNIANEFLDKDKLIEFTNQYELSKRLGEAKNVGLIFAGNIPLVGFHDWLCVMLAGHNALVKLSSKDDVLFPYILEKIYRIEPRLHERTKIVDQLKNFDAVIATGSNNSARYFEYYFGKYPHIIRKNRSSVAIVDEQTTPEELQLLADDVFAYFGLGCRNVSKLYVHQGVQVIDILKHFNKYASIADHNKYKNNFDFRYTIMLMNKQVHDSNGFVLAVENKSISSPLSILHYQYYNDEEDLQSKLQSQSENIQVVIGKKNSPFGTSQKVLLDDYADGVDVIEFLLKL